MKKHSTPATLLNAVDKLLPLIKQSSQTSEQLGHLEDGLLKALFELRLFKLFVPVELNGAALDLPSALQIFEKVASADGATGWLVMIGAGGGLFSGFLNSQAAQSIFADPRSVIAGSGAPSAIATRVDGGYRVSGRWAYASGAYHANWFTANCVIENGEQSEPEIIAVAIPAEQVQIHDTWSVFGMRATGSHDFSVENVFVADEFTFTLSKTPYLSEPIYQCPLETLASLSFASVAVGIAQHAYDEFDQFARHKMIAGTTDSLADDADVQKRLHTAEQLLSDSRSLLYKLADQVWQQALEHNTPEQALRDQVQQAGVQIVQNTIEASNLLYARAGMMPVFTDSAFGRAWRDLHTLSQHVIVAPN